MAEHQPSRVKGSEGRNMDTGYCPDDEPYAGAETEFLRECERYRGRHGKRFLVATDYLKVLLGMGYTKAEG